MKNWNKKFMELGFKLNQICVHQDILHRNCISIGRMECKLLNYLALTDDAVCMNDLSQEMNVSHSRITRIVDNLVKKEYARRFPSKTDRRRWYTEITSKGREMASKSYEDNLKIQDEIIEKLPEGKTEEIYNAMIIYMEALQQVIKEQEVRHENQC